MRKTAGRVVAPPPASCHLRGVGGHGLKKGPDPVHNAEDVPLWRVARGSGQRTMDGRVLRGIGHPRMWEQGRMGVGPPNPHLGGGGVVGGTPPPPGALFGYPRSLWADRLY